MPAIKLIFRVSTLAALVALAVSAAPVAATHVALASQSGTFRASHSGLSYAPQDSTSNGSVVLTGVSLSAAVTDPSDCPPLASSPSSFTNSLHAVFWTAVFSQFVGQHYVENDWTSPTGKHYGEGISESHPNSGQIIDCGGLLIAGYHEQELGKWTFRLLIDNQVEATIPFTLTGATPTATPVPRKVKKCKTVYRKVHGRRKKVKVCHLVAVKPKPAATATAVPTATSTTTSSPSTVVSLGG